MTRGQLAAASIAIAAALPLLAACTGDADDPASAAPTVDATSSAPATDAPVIDDTGDPFCDLAIETAPVGEEIASKTAGMSALLTEALTTGDVATINAWGADLAALDERMLGFYADGRQYIAGEPIEASWDDMESFVRDYSLAVATEAANATDTATFAARMGETATDARNQELMTAGPAAATAIRTYIDDRCDIMG